MRCRKQVHQETLCHEETTRQSCPGFWTFCPPSWNGLWKPFRGKAVTCTRMCIGLNVHLRPRRRYKMLATMQWLCCSLKWWSLQLCTHLNLLGKGLGKGWVDCSVAIYALNTKSYQEQQRLSSSSVNSLWFCSTPSDILLAGSFRGRDTRYLARIIGLSFKTSAVIDTRKLLIRKLVQGLWQVVDVADGLTYFLRLWPLQLPCAHWSPFWYFLCTHTLIALWPH